MSNKPIRSTSHRNEDKSKRRFEELIEPFFVTAWSAKDYGIDGFVDITTGDGSIDSVKLESKCFLVQLKSCTAVGVVQDFISYPVPVNKVTYWHNYNLPVAFCLYDVNADAFYYTWIDDHLISILDSKNADWCNQKSVTLKIPLASRLGAESLNSIKDYVLSWKMPARRKLSPGQYFSLKENTIESLKQYKEIANQFGFSSINEQIRQLEMDIELSIYRIAVTGLSRVGKSSLINSILGKEVSPTGFYPTTAVPIQIIPGHSSSVNVIFNDGSKISKPFSLDAIREYADQSLNIDNTKSVCIVTVEVKNQNLERGVTIFDLPGLDDPNDGIYEFAWQTARKANAILYVIDAAPFENGGFIFRNDFKQHITSFNNTIDKVFLVFNRVDLLSSDKFQLFKTRLEADLDKYNLLEKLGGRVFYVSTKKAVSGSDTIRQLNDTIWDFILGENKFGIIRLTHINQELFRNTKSLQQILNSRLLDSAKREQLQSLIIEVRSKLPTLQKAFKEHHQNKSQIFTQSIQAQKNFILLNLETGLKKIPVNNDFPNSDQIRKYLIDNIAKSIEHLNNDYVLQVNQLQFFIDTWIEENLKQVREILSQQPAQRNIDFTDIESFECPQIDFSSSFGMGVLGFLAGMIAAPEIAIIGGIFGFLGNLFTTIESRRAKRISKTMDRSRDRLDVIFGKMTNAYLEYFHDHCILIGKYADDKITFYFNDLDSQMQPLDIPLSDAEAILYKNTFKRIEELQSKLVDFDAELRSFSFVS